MMGVQKGNMGQSQCQARILLEILIVGVIIFNTQVNKIIRWPTTEEGDKGTCFISN